MEEVKAVAVETAPEVKAEVKPEVKEPDLMTRISQFKVTEKKAEPIEKSVEEHKLDDKFDYSKLKEIKTPEEAKRWAEDAYKSFQKGYNEKYQSIAEMRKDLERKMTEQTNWTPERIQSLLNDQNFVTAAQSVMASQNPPNSGKSDEDWSALTESEKSRFLDMQREINELKAQSQRATLSQQDEQLKSKYASYDPQAIDRLQQDLLSGRLNATREHLHKVLDYEAMARRAYELGKEEERKLKSEKSESFSFNPQSANVVKEQKVDGKLEDGFMTKLYEYHKQKTRESQLRK